MNEKDIKQAKRLIKSGISKSENKKPSEIKIEMTLKLKKELYSNYKNNNDKCNWYMETIYYLIWIEGCLEGLAYKRIHDKDINNLVMALIGYIKSNGFETITEIKG